jgi:short-subunit dehydrogenase
MDFSGKSVLLTGASSGIGFELSKKLSGKNCKIALLARSIDKIKDFALEYKTANNIILPVHCDVSKKEDVHSAVDKVIDYFGGIDIAILNSGTSERMNIENFSSETGEDIIRVNLLGKIYFMEKLIPYFIQKRSGMIVGISSLADSRGFPRSAFYNSSKAGLTKLLESIRIELKKYDVKVITVRPGFVRTPMTQKNEFHMPLLMSADKAAEIIIRGIKKEKRKIQFPLLTVLSTRIIESMPDSWFEYFAGKHLEGLKKKGL